MVDLPRRIFVAAPAAEDLRNGCKGGLDTCLISGYFSHHLEDLRQLGGGLGRHRLTVLAEGDHQGQEPLVDREVVLVELGGMGVDCLDVLTQPLSFGLQAAGGVKCPDHEGSPLLQPVEDLDGDAVYRSFDTPNMLRSVPLDRHGLTHHCCGRQDNLCSPADVESGKLRGNGACRLCRVCGHRNGTRPARYRGDRRRQVRRERPRRGRHRRRLSALVQILKGGFRGAQCTVENPAAKLALYHLVHTMTSQCKKHQKEGVDRQTDHVGWNLKVQPVSQ